jgi:hypothetical protein
VIAVLSLVALQPEAPTLVKPPLTAKVRATSAKACALDHDIVEFTFAGELTLVNESVEPVILKRGSPVLEYWRIATDLEALTARDWAHYSYYGTAPAGTSPTLGAAPDDRFVVVQPGRRHAEPIQWSFLVVGSFDSSRWVAQGIAVPSVEWDEESEHAASKAWSSIGRLWTGGIKTAVFDVDIGSEPIPWCDTVSPPLAADGPPRDDEAPRLKRAR